MPANNKRRRALVIGLDGATYRLIKPLQAAGQLPNLARLMAAGTACTLQSTIQPSSEQAWTAFMTGLNNGRHGVFGFQQRRPGTYQFDYVNGNSIRGQTLWGLLSRRGRDVIVINVPMTYPPEAVNGVLVGGLLSPGEHSKFTHPDGIYAELRQACGGYMLDVDTERGRLSREQLAQLAEDGLRMIRLRTCASLHLARTRPWDMFMVVYGASDRLAHKYWKYWDVTHPLHNPDDAGAFGDVLPAIYRELDDAVGKLLDALWDEDTTVFVLSDHGFGPMEKAVYLNRWLAQRGYLALQPESELDPARRLQRGLRGVLRSGVKHLDSPLVAGAKRWAFNTFPTLKGAMYSSVAFAQVDWSRTQAYALGTMGNIYFNRLGREPQGIVQAGAQADALAERLIADLHGLTDPQTGAPVFHSIYRAAELYHGPALAEAPDVVAVKDSRYHVVTADWRGGDEIVAALGQALHFASDQSGQHELPGILIAAGPTIRRDVTLEDANLVDMAATILYSMDEPIPTTMDSRPVAALFDPAWWAAHPPGYADGGDDEAGAAGGAQYSDEEEALLRTTVGRPRVSRLMNRRILRSILPALLAVAIVVFWGRALLHSSAELARYQWRIEWPWLLAAMGVLMLQSLLLATLWWYALRLMGAAVSWRLATSLWLKTQIARYLPGGLWDVAGRVTLGQQAGISVRASSASVALEMTLQILSASLFLVLLPALRGDVAARSYLPLAAGLILLCLAAAAPPVFSRLVNLLLRLLRKPALMIEMTYRDVLIMLAMRLLGHLMLGGSFVLFARGVSDISWRHAPVMTAGYVGAWLAGYLVVLAPMGIGVRESALALLLQGILPAGVIGVLGLGYRTWQLVRDMLAALLGVVLGRVNDKR